MRRSPLALALTAALAVSSAHAAKFSYHGELLDGDTPAEGAYDLRVRSYASPDAKAALGEATELPGVSVRSGSFALELDLPENPLGTTFVEVAVRKSGTSDKYETLGAPQAVSKVNTGCWALDGNASAPAGRFLGIADPNDFQPLELRVHNFRVARFAPAIDFGSDVDSPSIAFGHSGNISESIGTTISGGGGACPTCINRATGEFATVAGGTGNRAVSAGASVSGGSRNHAAAEYASVAGGRDNCAGGDYSFAGGWRAKIRRDTLPSSDLCVGTNSSGDSNGDEGTFAWADAQNLDFESSGPNQFLVRATGGVGINTAPPNADLELTIGADQDSFGYANLWLKQRSVTDSDSGMLISVGEGDGNNNAGFYLAHYNGSAQSRRFALFPAGGAFVGSSASDPNIGAQLPAGSGTWNAVSDRRLKTAIAAIDPHMILDRLVAMPLSTWSYIAQGEGVRHLGPMAQDFAAAFGLGENDTTISTVDADGVALAAIQGLNAKLERENAALREQLDAVTARLSRLEASEEH